MADDAATSSSSDSSSRGKCGSSTHHNLTPGCASQMSNGGSELELHHSLRRNQACLSCRKRKLKCDALRPVCGTCARSREAAAMSRYASPVPVGDCVYPETEGTGTDAAEQALPPAFRSKRMRSRPSYPKNTKKSRTIKDGDKDDKQDLLASVKRLESLLAESRATIQAQQEAAQRAGISLGTGANTEVTVTSLTTPSPVSAPQHGTKELAFSSTSAVGSATTQANQPITTIGTDLASTACVSSKSNKPPLISWNGTEIDRLMSLTNQPYPAIPGCGPYGDGPLPSPLSIESNPYGPLYGPSTGGQGEDFNLLAAWMMSSSWSQPSPSIGLPPPSTLSSAPAANLTEADPLYDIPNPNSVVQLFWPGWPSDLPSPETSLKLVDVFFERHPLATMLHQEQFKRRLHLSPESNQWPDRGLVHTVIAAAAPLSDLFNGPNPPEVNVSGDESLNTDMLHRSENKWLALGPLHPWQKPNNSKAVLYFSDYHMASAQAYASRALNFSDSVHGSRPLEWLQALIIVSDLLYGRARAIESYLLCGLLSKAMGPLGLLKLQPYEENPPMIPGSFLPPLMSKEEEARRRRTFWCAYMAETWHSNSGHFWTTALNDDTTTTSLPSLPGSDKPGQTLATPDSELFGTMHTDDFTLHAKGVILLKRVRALLSTPSPRTKVDLEFAKRTGSLNQAIHLFLSTCPRPTDARCTDLVCARLAALGALAILHEPFVDFSQPWSYPYAQIEHVIDETIELVDLIRTSVVDPTLIPARMLFTLSTAAKLIAEHLSHLRHSGGLTRRPEAKLDRLQRDFDKLLLLIRDMSNGGIHCAAQEAYVRLNELQRCKFDHAAMARHHFALHMPAVGTSRFQAAT